jgi:integrase
MKAHITKTLLQGLADPAEGKTKYRVFDARLAGFIAEKRAGGITFYIRYADRRRRTREVRLGRLGDVTLDQARKAAEKIKADVSLGGDPVAELERLRAVPTVAEFANDRYIPHCKERLLAWDCNDRYLRTRILPAIGNKALNEVTPADVATFRKRMLEAGYSAAYINRHLACIRSMYNAAIKWQVVDMRNPAASPGMFREEARDRYLTPEQTRALLAALGASKSRDAAAALALIAVSGGRKQEILRARWEHVDLARGMLTVPRAKSGRARHIPLSKFAEAIIQRQLPRRKEDSPWVFPSPRSPQKPITNEKRVWAAAKKAAGLPKDTRIHDLRHSFASALANAGVPLFEIGRVLGHSQLSTTTRYAHHAPERLVATASEAVRAWDLLSESSAA